MPEAGSAAGAGLPGHGSPARLLGQGQELPLRLPSVSSCLGRCRTPGLSRSLCSVRRFNKLFFCSIVGSSAVPAVFLWPEEWCSSAPWR